jgi:hypothetical protein
MKYLICLTMKYLILSTLSTLITKFILYIYIHTYVRQNNEK